MIKLRRAYYDAIAGGLAVFEGAKRDTKAGEEFDVLARELRDGV